MAPVRGVISERQSRAPGLVNPTSRTNLTHVSGLGAKISHGLAFDLRARKTGGDVLVEVGRDRLLEDQ